jgi:GrpB-like predicted nucleotidyltransferase (UPF0157 family)
LNRVLSDVPGLRLEHIGSTAVPGLAAKPIIDIMMAVASRQDWDRVLQALQSLDYVHKPEAFDVDHWFFVKGMPPYGARRTHQIHLWKFGERLWREHLAFRDCLRSKPSVVAEYEALKRELAVLFTFDREGYTAAKTEFIQGALKAADLS